MFTEALFIIARTCKQPKCPSLEGIKMMWYIHTYTHINTQNYYSAIKKNEIMLFAAT